jgi:hypothetical protein
MEEFGMHITTTKLGLRPQLARLDIPALKRPKLKLRVSLAAFFVTIGEAFQLAYVAPFETGDRRDGRSGADGDERI